MEPKPSRSRRLLAASLAGGIHFALQVGLYGLAFVVGPEGVTREVLGVTLYDVTSVVTFPFVYLSERLGSPGFGMLAFPLNSGAWGGCLYLALTLASRRRRRGTSRH